MARLALAFDEVLAVTAPVVAPGVSVVALVGDLREAEAVPLLEAAFGDLTPGSGRASGAEAGPSRTQIDLAVAVAQAALGYVVAAPPPSHPDWFAWRILLYVLSHGYEGRLGSRGHQPARPCLLHRCAST